MKRLSFFGVSIAIVVLVALGVWFINRPKPILPVSPVATNSATFPESQLALPSLLVTPIASNVTVALAAQPLAFAPINTSTQVVGGSHVKTDATGRALIEGTHTTVLDSNTEITLAAFDTQKNQTRLRLEAGNVWSRVKKLSDKGEFYEIETQTARASVRGTSFGLSKKGNVTTLYVVEGIVNFGTIPPETDDSIRFSAANVSAGKKAVLLDGALVPIVSDITKKDKQDPWFVFNNPTVGAPPSSAVLIQNPSSAVLTETISTPLNEMIAPAETPLSPVVSIQPEQTTVPVIEETIPTTPTTTPPPNRTITPATPNSPELLLSTVSPNSIVAGTSATLTISGSGFIKAGVFTVLIGNTRMTSLKVVDDSTIQVSVSAGQFPAGSYNVLVEGTSNTTSTLFSGLTVTRAPISQTPLR